jgi:hypothetical protein
MDVYPLWKFAFIFLFSFSVNPPCRCAPVTVVGAFIAKGNGGLSPDDPMLTIR